MRKKTELTEVKKIAKVFLRLDYKKTEYYPVIVTHPFFQSGMIYKQNCQKEEQKEDCYYYLDRPEDLAEIYKLYDDKIDKANDLGMLLLLVNRAYRLVFFKYIKEYLSKNDFSKWLAYLWTDSENPNQDVNVSRKECIRWFKQADKSHLMNEKEYNLYQNMPNQIVLYRGVGKGRERLGLSWTASHEKAQWFAKRWGGDGYIIKVTAMKQDVLCYLNGRNEDEYVLDVFKYKDIIAEEQSYREVLE